MQFTLAASDLFTQLLPWLGGLVVVAILGGFIMAAARKLVTQRSSMTPSAGFTLQDLRRLHESGEITQAQFEKAKQLFLNTEKAALLNAPAQTAKKTSKSSKKTL